MVHSRAFRDVIGNPMSAPWFLEFRFWNLGFLILGFGFRLLNLDFQSLDFGTWIVKILIGTWTLQFWVLSFGAGPFCDGSHFARCCAK